MPHFKLRWPLVLPALTAAALAPQAGAQTVSPSQALSLTVSADLVRRDSGRGLGPFPSAGLGYQVALPGTSGELRVLGHIGVIHSLDLDFLLPLSGGVYAGLGGGYWAAIFSGQGLGTRARALIGAQTPPNRGLGAFGEVAAQWAFSDRRCDVARGCEPPRQRVVPTVRFGTLYRF